MGVLPCQPNQEPDSDQSSNPKTLYSDSSSSSSKSFSSLASQPSLPSVPSLTASISSLIEHPLSSKASHHCLATLKGGGAYIFCLALAGKHLYCGSSNGDILVSGRDPSQDGNSNSSLRLVAQSGSAVKSIVILGDKLISAHQDHRIRVWKIDNELTHHRKHNYYKCIATLPTLNDRCMKLFSAKNYVEVRRHKKCTWVHHVDTVSAMALSADGALLYSVSWDRTLKLWRTSDFKCLQSIWNAHKDAVNAVAVSPDGLAVYTGSADKKIKVWEVNAGDKRRLSLAATLEKHKSTVNALALSTDGSVLYSGACDRSIIVWEKDGGGGPMVVAGALRGHTKAILSLAVVAELVVSGSADKTVRMWKRGVGKSYFCVGVLEGHSGPVKCLTATLDTKNSNTKDEEGNCGNSYMVYSGSLDCDVKVWRIWSQF
ncbi:protein JINGUBANG-like [Ipomoea triloba]|uniref:protein JINGUBANG-like n=1 Tax=Ipomoea triloba TaxID=35885 RepID=UPI00125D3090|nr:protein JINGUBANG-like [Ipomoea triloba]